MSVERVPVTGWWGTESDAENVPSSIRHYSHPGDMFADENILGVINCTPLPERVFWCEQALEAGKAVLSASPLGERYGDVRRLIRAGRDILIASPAHYGAIGKATAARNGLGNLLFFDLQIRLSQTWIAHQKYGVLLLGGVDHLSSIERRWGPVDSIWARSRSLVRNRPTEDISQIYIKCKNGKEGSLTINGLGNEPGERLLLYGRRGSCEISGSGEGNAGAWRGAYRDFLERLAGNEKNGFDGVMAQDGFRLMHWVQQAARHNREINRGEMSDG